MNHHITTIQAGVRAFQRYLMMDVSPELGKERVRAFRAALPKAGMTLAFQFPAQRPDDACPVPRRPLQILSESSKP